MSSDVQRAMDLAAAAARWVRFQAAADALDREAADLLQQRRQARQAEADAYVEFLKLARGDA